MSACRIGKGNLVRPANESRVVVIGTAIAVVVALLFALSLGAVLLVSRTVADPASVAAMQSPVTTLAPSPNAAQVGAPDSTQVQVTPTSPAATSTNNDPASEPSTPLSTHTTRPLPPTATAPSPTVPMPTLAPPPPPETPTVPVAMSPGPSTGTVVSAANVRDQPSPDGSTVIGSVTAGETVTLRRRTPRGDWYAVETSRGLVGWVSAMLLDVDPAVAARLPTGTTDPEIAIRPTAAPVAPAPVPPPPPPPSETPTP